MERLGNKILEYLFEKGCTFPKSSGNIGKMFLLQLTLLLWYIDGHNITIERDCHKKIPQIFNKFKDFNRPELSKHRKREIGNLSSSKLSKLTINLKETIQCMSFIETREWVEFKVATLTLINILENYSDYLNEKNEKIQKIQATPKSNLEKQTNVTVLPLCKKTSVQLEAIDEKLKEIEFYEPISLREYVPAGLDRRRVYDIVQNVLLSRGLSMKAVHYVFKPGGSKQSLHFVWKIQEDLTETNLINECLKVISKVDENLPIYERRITKREFKRAYGFIASPVAIRSIFKELTGDRSSPTSLTESEIDKRFEFALLSEDPHIAVDLRNQPKDRKSDKFSEFFKETETYLSTVIGSYVVLDIKYLMLIFN